MKAVQKVIWYLYFIRTKEGNLYTGVTTDVKRRFDEHQSGKGARYLRGKGPLTLCHSFKVGSRSDACSLEAKLKKISKMKKEKLITGKWKKTKIMNAYFPVIKIKD